ncbi:hypothetical protein H0E87_003198, partial [Populus deltoides]
GSDTSVDHLSHERWDSVFILRQRSISAALSPQTVTIGFRVLVPALLLAQAS